MVSFQVSNHIYIYTVYIYILYIFMNVHTYNYVQKQVEINLPYVLLPSFSNNPGPKRHLDPLKMLQTQLPSNK